MGSSRRGSRSRPRSRTLRRGLAPAYAVMIVLLIFIAYFILMKIYLAELWSIHNIEETYDIYRRKLEHTASLRIEDIRFIFVNEWNAKVLIEVMNIGFESINLSYVELIYKRCKVYNYSYSLTGELFSCVRIDTDYSPRVWTEDGDRRLYPGERGWIESSKTFDILWLYAYLNSNTTRYYIDLMIITDAGRTIHKAIAPKPAALELNVYIDNLPAQQIDVKLYRLEAPGTGLAYEFYRKVALTSYPFYLELKNLIPGKYLVVINASNSAGSIGREYIVTLDPSEVETIVIDAPGKPKLAPKQGQSFWRLDFSDMPTVKILLLKNLSYWWFEGDAEIDLAASDYEETGLKLNVNGPLNISFKTPRLSEGEYNIVLSYATTARDFNFTKIIVDGKPYAANLSCRDSAETEPPGGGWGSVSLIECTVYINVSFKEVEQHEITSISNGEGTYLRIDALEIVPNVGYRETVAQLVTTLWPGDVYRVREVQQGNVSKLVIEKVDEGEVAFYSCDNSSSSATPERDPNDQYWFWVSPPSVRGNSTETWLFNNPFRLQRRDHAELRFTVSCSNACYVYAYGMLGSYNERVVRPIIRLVVDNTMRDFVNTPGVFRLLRAELAPGTHSISIVSEAYWYIATQGWLVRSYVDHILVVKNKTIVIEGLKLGYVVRIIDLDNNQIVYEARVTNTTLTINAESIGIYRFPMNALIEVIRP